jgi:hypothetical protein
LGRCFRSIDFNRDGFLVGLAALRRGALQGNIMAQTEVIALEAFYPYGFQGREMMAVRAPFAMDAEASGFVGRLVGIGEGVFRVLAVWRQVHGPIAAGEPIGVELCSEPPEKIQQA